MNHLINKSNAHQSKRHSGACSQPVQECLSAVLDACTPLHVYAAALCNSNETVEELCAMLKYSVPNSLYTISWGANLQWSEAHQITEQAVMHATQSAMQIVLTQVLVPSVTALKLVGSSFGLFPARAVPGCPSTKAPFAPQPRPHWSSTTDPQILHRSNGLITHNYSLP